VGGQPLQPFLGAARAQRLLRQGEALVDVPLPQRRGGEARVGEPLRPLERAGQRLPFLVALHRDADVAGRGLVDQVEEAGRLLLGYRLLREGLAAHVGTPEEGHDRVQHGQPHVLPRRAAGARQQRGGDRLGRDGAGQLVRQDGAHQARRRLVRARLHGGEAAERLDQRVVDRLLGVGPGLAEAADGDVDDAGRRGAHRRLAEAHALGDAGAEVLHEDVGARGQAQQRLHRRRVLQVERDRALAAVVVEEGGGEAAAPVGPEPGVVAAGARVLHLDHLGPLVGQQHGGGGPRDHGGEVHDPVAVQGSWHGALLRAGRASPEAADAPGRLAAPARRPKGLGPAAFS
jgi:hypothetical protein